MKRDYIVRMTDGYYVAENKKDALGYLKYNDRAVDVVLTASKNHYHNRVNVIATK